jgi:hypothetical protein
MYSTTVEDWVMQIKPAFSLSLFAALTVHNCIFAVSSSGLTLHIEPPYLKPPTPSKNSLLCTAVRSDEHVKYVNSSRIRADNITNFIGNALHTNEKGPDGIDMSTESNVKWLCGLDSAVIGGEVSPFASFNAWAEQVPPINAAILASHSPILTENNVSGFTQVSTMVHALLYSLDKKEEGEVSFTNST